MELGKAICWGLWGWQYLLWHLAPHSHATARAKVIYLKAFLKWYTNKNGGHKP